MLGPITRLASFIETARPGVLGITGIAIAGFNVAFQVAMITAFPSLAPSEFGGLASWGQPEPTFGDRLLEFLQPILAVAVGTVQAVLYVAAWAFIAFAAARLVGRSLEQRPTRTAG